MLLTSTRYGPVLSVLVFAFCFGVCESAHVRKKRDNGAISVSIIKSTSSSSTSQTSSSISVSVHLSSSTSHASSSSSSTISDHQSITHSTSNTFSFMRVFDRPSVTPSTSDTSSSISVPSHPSITPSISKTSSSISVSDQPSTTPSATLPSNPSATNATSTITQAPQWGNQSIPSNTCSGPNESGIIVYTPCHIFAGTVQLSYFPENKGNRTGPTTYYDPHMSVTMTSPSIYMIVNTVTGGNDCGPLGPTYSTKVISMNPEEVLTIPPYADEWATTRMGEIRGLTLSDLENCPHFTKKSTTGEILNTHPVDNDYNRCNPRLVFPIQLKRLGYPYWSHCGELNYVFGIFDPPGAVPSAGDLFPTTTSTPPLTSSYESASAPPSAIPDQAASTTTTVSETKPTESSASEPIPNGGLNPPPPSQEPVPSTKPGGVFVSDPPPLKTNSPSPSPPAPSPSVIVIGTNTLSAIAGSSGIIVPGGSTASVGAVNTFTDSNGGSVIVSVGTSGIFVGGSDSLTTFHPNPTTQPGAPIPAPSPSAIVVVGSQTISAIAGSSGIILPGGSTASVGAVNTLTDSNGGHVIISVGTSGIFVGGADSLTTFHPNPTLPPAAPNNVPTPSAVVVVGSQTVSAIAGSAGVLLPGGSTASVGSVATLTDANGDHAIVSVGSSGLFVGGTDSKTTFFANPTQPAAQAPTPIATIGVQVISAKPGDSTIVINGQVITSGGAQVTMPGSNDIATFGSDGLVVQFPGGGVSTFAIPTPTATHASLLPITIAGEEVKATSGASLVIIGNQTLSLGGNPVTLVNNNVVSLGADGVVVQMPGGQVSTATLPEGVTVTEAAGTESSLGRIGNAIASSATPSTTSAQEAGTGVTAVPKTGPADSIGCSSVLWLCSILTVVIGLSL